ncbi:transcriptional regulator [Saccharothrix violaceirubra]|uniref:Transcriptional regulator n=1 Tax=Saccharothrix violaceirubra TaxID=413306 RepID=A0A7W7SXA2_9PSEU|nr:transcriptional regulator [Saccharothrix violaceirubra]MBB4962683.1 hypothetical protein [Saccharothrix violaceirubra]
MQYTIRLRREMFRKAKRLAGFPSDSAVAKAIGVHRSTVKRILDGEIYPGPAFIAGMIMAFSPLRFDDLFEIVRVKVDA